MRWRSITTAPLSPPEAGHAGTDQGAFRRSIYPHRIICLHRCQLGAGGCRHRREVLTATVATSTLYTVTTNAGGTNVGSYDVVLTLSDSANYKWTDSEEAAKTLTFQITQATAPTVTTPTPDAVTYDPAKTLENVALPSGWAWVDSTTVSTVSNNGYAAAYTVPDDTNYDYTNVNGYDAQTHTVTRTVALTVNKIHSTAATVTAENLTYSGAAMPLVNVDNGTLNGGTMQYALGTNESTAPTDGWDIAIPTAVNVGTYTVWSKVIGDNVHNDSNPVSVAVTIAPKQVGLTWSNTSFTYNGQSHIPTATATGLVGSDQCVVTVSGAQTNAGTYTATATALSNANYKLPDKATTSFTIEEAPETPTEPASQTAPDVPVVTAITGTSITVKTVKGQQYSIDGGKTWKTATGTSYTFKNLTPGKQYTVVTRKAETANANASAASKGTKVKTLSNAMMLKNGLKIQEKGKKIYVSVGKVPGATSYQVFVQYCSKGNFSKTPALTIKNGKTSGVVKKINKKAIDTGASYKVLVVAMKGDKVLAKSPILHGAGSAGDYTDVKSLSLTKTAYTLTTKKTATITAKQKLLNTERKTMTNFHGNALRFVSSDTSVATVNSNGKITAKKAGTCVILVTARNGITKQVTVIVPPKK